MSSASGRRSPANLRAGFKPAFRCGHSVSPFCPDHNHDYVLSGIRRQCPALCLVMASGSCFAFRAPHHSHCYGAAGLLCCPCAVLNIPHVFRRLWCFLSIVDHVHQHSLLLPPSPKLSSTTACLCEQVESRRENHRITRTLFHRLKSNCGGRLCSQACIFCSNQTLFW